MTSEPRYRISKPLHVGVGNLQPILRPDRDDLGLQVLGELGSLSPGNMIAGSLGLSKSWKVPSHNLVIEALPRQGLIPNYHGL